MPGLKRDAFRGPLIIVIKYLRTVIWSREETSLWLQRAELGLIDWFYAWSQRVNAKPCLQESDECWRCKLCPHRSTKKDLRAGGPRKARASGASAREGGREEGRVGGSSVPTSAAGFWLLFVGMRNQSTSHPCVDSDSPPRSFPSLGGLGLKGSPGWSSSKFILQSPWQTPCTHWLDGAAAALRPVLLAICSCFGFSCSGSGGALGLCLAPSQMLTALRAYGCWWFVAYGGLFLELLETSLASFVIHDVISMARFFGVAT